MPKSKPQLQAAQTARDERARAILKLLAQGEREIRAGRGRDLDVVLSEADQLLARR